MNTSATVTTFAKNLHRQAPRSPMHRLGGYAILARLIDKCRARLEGQIANYNDNTPLENYFFEFKGIQYEDLNRETLNGLSDQELLHWVNTHGKSKTLQEIEEWSAKAEKLTVLYDPKWKDLFISRCQELKINPEQTTLFDWIEIEDRQIFKTP